MSELNYPLKDSYIGKVGSALEPYKEELTAKGFDPASRIEQLTGAGKLIEAAVKVRKQAERSACEAVSNEHSVRDNFYTLAASTVALVEGLLGKNHELPIKLRHMRAELIGNQNPSGKPVEKPHQ